MEPVKAFQETATTVGIAVAVLLVIVAGLLFILWKIGMRLTTGHEAYLEKTAKAAEAQAASIAAIQTTLPTVCQAACPKDDCENYRPRTKPKPA